MAALAPRIHEAPDDLLAAIDYCYEQGWTDGLPVVPPVVDRVKAMLAADSRPPETVIAHHPATGLDLSLHAAAVNAVMAGCLPEYFPVLVAAFEAMDRPDFNFHGSTASTGGSAPLLVVSGPYADEIGMNADVNLFGPGNRRQRHDRPGDAADPAQRLPDAARHLRQVDPGQSRQVQLLHRRARARQSVAAAVRGAGLCQGRVERHGLRRRRLLQCREPRRQHARADPGLGRRRDGELRLHHARPERGDPGARAHAASSPPPAGRASRRRTSCSARPSARSRA